LSYFVYNLFIDRVFLKEGEVNGFQETRIRK